MTSRAPFLVAVLSFGLGAAACSGTAVESIPAPEPPAKPAPEATEGTTAPEGPVQTLPRDAKKNEPQKEHGAPNLSGDNECVIARWSTAEPAWRRDTAKWNAQTSTLELPDTERHLNAQGRIADFGEGTDQMAYDAHGNIVSRTAGKAGTGYSYRYENKYDAKQRLIAVSMTSKPREGGFGKLEPYRSYTYDAAGRIATMGVQTIPHNPLVPAKLDWDERGRLVKVTWGEPGKAVLQVDTMKYDDAGRLTDYTRDGLIVARGKAADGVIEWSQHWDYGDNGFPSLMDGIEGLDAASAPHEQTRWSPACAEIGKRWQDLYVYPYLALPATLTPRFAGQ